MTFCAEVILLRGEQDIGGGDRAVLDPSQNYPQHHSQESRGEERGKSSTIVFGVRQTQGKILLLLPIGCVESEQIQLIIRILRDAVRKQWS